MDQQTHLKVDNLKRIQVATLIMGSKHYPIYKGINTIGRNKTAVVNIKHLNISQNQAIIVVVDETQHYLSDMNSSNGTFLIEKKICPLKLYELTDKAEIKFGDLNAVYSKISAKNTTLNFEQSMQASQLTQTQDIYASNTQVIFSKKDLSSVLVNGDDTHVDSNAHEAPTQIIFNPPFLPNIRKEPKTAMVQNQIIEEVLDTQFHDAPTQVCNFISDISVENANLHEVPTQACDFTIPTNENQLEQIADNDSQSKNSNSTSDPNTQIMTTEEKEAICSKINNKNDQVTLLTSSSSPNLIDIESKNDSKEQETKYHNVKRGKIIHDSQEPSTSGVRQGVIECNDSFANSVQNNRADDVLIEETLIENANSNDSLDFLVAKNTVEKTDLNSLSQCSMESDFILRSKRPILKLPDTQCNSDSDTDTEDFIKVSKPLRKLPSTQTDSETDIEITQDMIKTIGKPITEPELPNTPTNSKNIDSSKGKLTDDQSDSETDCEEAVLEKLPTKTIEDVGSDTDIEADKNKCDFDDSDCIPATQDDAFAKALNYKSLKSCQMTTLQSSEESFKLGLTELMDFSETEAIDKAEEVSLKSADIQGHLGIEDNKEDSTKAVGVEDNMNTVTDTTKHHKNFVFKKVHTTLDTSLTTILSTNNKENDQSKTTNKGYEIDDDCSKSNPEKDDVLPPTQKVDDYVFIQPTQPLGYKKLADTQSLTQDDIYLEPTQQLEDVFSENITNKTKHNDNQKRVHGVDDACLKNNTETDKSKLTNEDVYLQPTQTMDDDVFLQPTQLLVSKPVVDTVKATKDDIYLQPTQQLDDIFSENITNETTDNDNQKRVQEVDDACLKSNTETDKSKLTNEDVYLQPTEKMDDDAFLQPTQLLVSKTVVDTVKATKDDIYLQPTQQLDDVFPENSTNKTKHKDNQKRVHDIDDVYLKSNTETDKPKLANEDVYLQPTQKMNDDVFLQPTRLLRSKNFSDTVKPTKEDVYLQPTQQLDDVFLEPTQIIKTHKSKDAPNSESEDAYLQPTQILDMDGQSELMQSGNGVNEDSKTKTNVTETQLEMESFDNIEPDILNRSDRPGNPIVSELNNCKDNSQVDDLKNGTTADDAKYKNPLNSNTRDIETLSQIEAFLNKPLPPRKSVRKQPLQKEVEKANAEEESETLSQIDAFVTKSLSRGSTVKAKEGNKVNEEKSSGRVSKRRTSKTHNEEPGSRKVTKKIESFDVETLIRSTLDESNEEESDKTNSSRELRSDIDQSFALLDSKSSRVKRKPNSDPVLDEIKVTITSHRRSMHTAENKNLELIVPTKKSRAAGSVSASGIPEIVLPSTRSRHRKAKLPSNSSESKSDSKTSIIETKPGKSNTKNTSDDTKGSSSSNTKSTGSRKLKTEQFESTISEEIKSTKNRESKDRGRQKNEKTEPTILDDFVDSKDTKPTRTNRQIVKSNESEVETTAESKTIKRHSEYSGPPTPAKRSRTARAVNYSDTSDDNKDSSSSKKEQRRGEGSGFSTPGKRSRISKAENHSDTSDDSKESSSSKKKESLPQANTSSSERSKRKIKPKVVFTMLDSPQLESSIKHLGGSCVDTVKSATVLVTSGVKRSQKLLTAVAEGKPICTPDWIKDSRKNGAFLDPWDYLLVDKEAESKWNFSLKQSLERAENIKLLDGYTFQLIVSNAADVLKGAIEASGGKCVSKPPPKNQLDKFIIVSSPEHRSKYTKMKKQLPEVTVVEPEAIFDGVLRQELRLSRHILT